MHSVPALLLSLVRLLQRSAALRLASLARSGFAVVFFPSQLDSSHGARKKTRMTNPGSRCKGSCIIGPLIPEKGGIAGPVFSSRAVSRTIHKSAQWDMMTSVSRWLTLAVPHAPLFQKAPHPGWLMQSWLPSNEWKAAEIRMMVKTSFPDPRTESLARIPGMHLERRDGHGTLDAAKT
ncbi:hypothetical protein QBC34DRAFT_395633 [Podospora aff. communis PSN243]|uniref:Secreted protein n=1 Tax=Podospora aff. communis PSN243 TaxID=3040156 RepID=A0AAV9H3E4_9PEZI|nr:hypothetical protein QBC34DRAFT_395633 [Podospora aff. communis PSN243]